GNEIAVNDQTLAKTGTFVVSLQTPIAMINAATIAPGNYNVCARLADGALIRYLYAPTELAVTPSQQLPFIDTLSLHSGVMTFNVHGFPGQIVTIQASTDLATWVPLQTYTFTGTVWLFTDTHAGEYPSRFYRAALGP
ncbi:MAG TPA: hypothetical protein VGL24_06365, partial [Chthoniobacterales bacterium]